MEFQYIEVSRMGTAFLPGKYSDSWVENPVRQFATDPGERNQAMAFLKRGGTLVLVGAWPEVQAVYQEVLKHEQELIPRVADRRERALAIRDLHQRVLTTLESLPILDGVITEAELPGFMGELSLPESTPVLVPVQDAEQLLQITPGEHPVRAIGASLVVHPDVLMPMSQELIEIMCEAIKSCEPAMPESARVLEVGCGSGVLSIASWQILQAKSPSITATDILPEASATTRLNWRRAAAIGKAGPESALTTHSGNLFDTVEGQMFDLIIFNAPWVVAPAHNRLEYALNDENQNTIRAFVEGSPEHLSPGGRVLVGYADNGGPKAMQRLEDSFTSANLTTERVLKDRIHTRRAKRQWQSIYAYVLRSCIPGRTNSCSG